MKHTYTNPRLYLLGTVAVMAITGLSSPVAAAETAEQDGLFTLLGRIILGAGAEKVAIDTPQAVTVLNQDDIDRTQATSVGELFDTIPGIQAIGSNRSGGLSFNIRGVGELAASDESKIIVTVDGVPKFYEQYRQGSFFSDPELFKRVEVLRGPASSTLYGAGALGGVVNFTTKEASDFLTEDKNTAIRTRLGFDSNGNGKLGSVIYAQRFSDSFEMLTSFNYRDADMAKDGAGNLLVGTEGISTSGLLKGTYRFGDDKAQSLNISYVQKYSNLNDTPYSRTDTLAFGTVDRRTNDQTLSLSYENPGLGNPLLDLKVALSYSNTEIDQDDAQFGFFGSLFNDSHYSYETIGLKVENTFEMSGANWENYLTAGVQFSDQDRTAQTTAGELAFHPEGNEQKIGVYVQSEFILGDRLTIIPGARLDYTALTPVAGAAGSEVTYTTFSPKIQVMYDVNDSFSVFGSLAHTERAPTLDEAFSHDRGYSISPALTKESANSIELGFAFQRRGIFNESDAFSLKTTAFYSDVSDTIVTNINALPAANYLNAQDALLWGVEIEGAYQSERMFGNFALSFVDGESTGMRGVGDTQSSIPAPNLSLTLGGRIPDRGIEYGWTGHFVDNIVTAQFDGVTRAAVNTRYSGYARHDLFVSWKPEQGVLQGTDLRLSLNNVFDRDYQNNLWGTSGKGRNVKLTLSKSF